MSQVVGTYLILSLVPYPYGGGESFLYQTIQWAQEKNFRCVWVAFGRNTHRRTSITNESNTIFHLYAGYPSDERLAEIYSLYQPDIIHTQGPIVYLSVPFFKKIRVPLLVGYHFWCGIMEPNEHGGWNNRDILSHLDREKLNPLCQEKAHFIQSYVASDFINSVIQGLGGQPIPNVLYPVPATSHYALDEPRERKYVTIVNVNRGKGGDIFLDVVKAIKDIPFIAICNEPNPDHLDDEIAREINGKFLRYTDIREVYAETKILLVPSHVDETFSRVAYEGAANGIPVITTGKGFIKHLLGSAAIELGESSEDWIETIRFLYYKEDEIARRGKLCREAVAKFSLDDQKKKFDHLLDNLYPLTPKKNIMILAPWCDQGLGLQAKMYSQLLRHNGYKVHIFSFLSYFCLDTLDTFQNDPHEWREYDTIHYSYNTREEITERELRQFILSRNIGICLIPEICYAPVFDKAAIIRKYNVDCYAIPNIETCRKDELDKYKVFNKILCNTQVCYDVLKNHGVSNLEYIGHCLPLLEHPISKKESGTLKFLHISGYNSLTRKQTIAVLKSFREAQQIVGDKISLTVTFSKNIPVEALSYDGNGITLIKKSLSHRQILDLYASHHISIQVSSHEGLGLGFYESIACGTPVISLDQPPHNEVIREGRSGWLLPSEAFTLTDNNQAMVTGGKVITKYLVEKITLLACQRDEVDRVSRMCLEESDRWSQKEFIKRLVTAISR